MLDAKLTAETRRTLSFEGENYTAKCVHELTLAYRR